MTAVWSWAKANDLPNWFAVAFTAVVWPIALFLWQRRTVNNIPSLEVRFTEGRITIHGKPFDAIDIELINNTNSVVYLSGARIRKCSPAFQVPVDADRDIAENSYQACFMDQNGHFVTRQTTLQTTERAKTCIAVLPKPDPTFFTYSAPWYRRLVRRPKYFILEYTAMVGTKRYAVSTLY